MVHGRSPPEASFSWVGFGAIIKRPDLEEAGGGTMPEAEIIDRGRGPEIAGSRITVYDVMDYLKDGWPAKEIAWLFHLSTAQVHAAIHYIEEHQDEVMADYKEMLSRDARGNPPELQAKLDAGHERFLAMVRESREAKSREARDAGASGGH
jgi:uncharacterized protein (DUF433 family)